MKKLISLFLSILMVVSLFAGITVSAVGEGSADKQYYFFNPANIADGTSWAVNSVFDTRGLHKGDGRLIPTTYGMGRYDHASGTMFIDSLLAAPANAEKSLTVYNEASTAKIFKVFMKIAHDTFPAARTVDADTTRGVQDDYRIDDYAGESSWSLGVNGGTKSAASLGNYPVYTDQGQTKIKWLHNDYQNGGMYNMSGYVREKIFDWFVTDVILQPGFNTLDLKAGEKGGIIESIFVTDDTTLTTSDLYYEGRWHTQVMMGHQRLTSYYANKVIHYADGVEKDKTGLINMQLYSDNSAPTASITNDATTSSTPGSITVNFATADGSLVFENAGDANYIGGRTASGLLNPNADNTLSFTDYYNSDDALFPYEISKASGVAEIKIYRDGTLVKTLKGAETTATSWVDDGTGLDGGFEEGAPYTYKIEAYDFFGNKAEATGTITSYGEPDTTVPTWTGDTVEVADTGLSSTITWPEAADNRRISYEIYADSKAPENLIETTTTTSCTIDLALNETKNVVVYAKDSAGNYTETGLPATIQSRPGTEHFLLRQEHFEMPDPALKIWYPYQISGDERDLLGAGRLNRGALTEHDNGRKARIGQSGAEVSANIWVDTPGEYAAYMLVEQNGGGIHLTINDQRTSKALGSTAVTNEAGTVLYGWVKADRIYDLKAGWNTVTVKSVSSSGSFVAIYVTNGTTIKTDELTYAHANNDTVVGGKLNTSKYDDIAGPTFAAGNLTVAYDTVAGTATLAWPAATDMPEAVLNVSTAFNMAATGLQSYKIYVDDNEIGEVDNVTTSFVLDETTLGRKLALGETINIKVEALDIYGNKSAKELTYEVSKFIVSNFQITNGAGGAANALLLLGDGTVKATATIKNVSEAPADVRLAIAIYDNATGQLLYGNVAEATIANGGTDHPVTATITGAPTDLTGCTVKAHLWDAKYAPIASTIEISE
mgnify:CR=1 FL=1